jgi:hypothetical protein
MLCTRDLNNIISVNEKLGSGPPNMSRISNFCCLVKNCDLFDLGYNGPAYTWTNKRFTTNPTFECLDHCLANIEWCTQFPTADVYHLPMMRSDHAPIFMVLQSNRAKEKRLFRFENFWLAENDFKQIVKQSWNLSRNTYFQTSPSKKSSCISIRRFWQSRKSTNARGTKRPGPLKGIEIQFFPPIYS